MLVGEDLFKEGGGQGGAYEHYVLDIVEGHSSG